MTQTDTETRELDPTPQRNRTGLWLGLTGLASLVIGLIVGFSGVDKCGSPFAPDSSAAEMFDAFSGWNTASGCSEDLSGPTAAAWAFTLIGVLLIILGVVLGSVLNRPKETAAPAVQPPAPSAADRLTALEHLHAAGTITDEEYRAKRTQLVEEL